MTAEMKALSLLHRHNGDKKSAELNALEILDDVTWNGDQEEIDFWEAVLDELSLMEEE
jgi:hypothetical protein